MAIQFGPVKKKLPSYDVKRFSVGEVLEGAEKRGWVPPWKAKAAKLSRVVKAMKEEPEEEIGHSKITIRLDNRVIAAFKALGPGYQGKINEALLKLVRAGPEPVEGED